MRFHPWILGAALAGLTACSAPPTVYDEVQAFDDLSERLFILEFDREGRLANPLAINQAARALRTRAVKKLLVLSFGWRNDRESAAETYAEFVRDYLADVGERSMDGWAVLGVAWDSRTAGFGGLVEDVVPVPGLGRLLGAVPENLLFPFSFWSKAKLADAIGSGDLATALSQILDELDETPDVYLVGHSFGCRLLAWLPIMDYYDSFRSAVFILPAATSLNLWIASVGSAGVFVVQSRHDHANDQLYPVASTLINPTVLQAGDLAASGFASEALQPERDPPAVAFVKDLVWTPVSLVAAVVLKPVDYLLGQVHEVRSRRFDYLPDTLAQLPVLEIAVQSIDRHIGEPRGWGDRNKGLFSLGILSESAASSTAIPLRPETEIASQRGTFWKLLNIGSVHHSDFTLQEVLDRTRSESLTVPSRFTFIDASEELSRGIYGLDYEHPAFEYSVGWLDPLGCHSQYRTPSVHALIHRVLNDRLRAKPWNGETIDIVP